MGEVATGLELWEPAERRDRESRDGAQDFHAWKEQTRKPHLLWLLKMREVSILNGIWGRKHAKSGVGAEQRIVAGFLDSSSPRFAGYPGFNRAEIHIVKAIVGSTEAKDEKALYEDPCASIESIKTADSSCESKSSLFAIQVPKNKSEDLSRNARKRKQSKPRPSN